MNLIGSIVIIGMGLIGLLIIIYIRKESKKLGIQK